MFHMGIVSIPYSCEMKISYVALNLIRKSSISRVKCIFLAPKFHMQNFEPDHFTCELAVSYVKMFQFHMF